MRRTPGDRRGDNGPVRGEPSAVPPVMGAGPVRGEPSPPLLTGVGPVRGEPSPPLLIGAGPVRGDIERCTGERALRVGATATRVRIYKRKQSGGHEVILHTRTGYATKR